MTTEHNLNEEIAVIISRLDNHDTAIADLKADSREIRSGNRWMRIGLFFLGLISIFTLVLGVYLKTDEVQKEISHIRVEHGRNGSTDQ